MRLRFTKHFQEKSGLLPDLTSVATQFQIGRVTEITKSAASAGEGVSVIDPTPGRRSAPDSGAPTKFKLSVQLKWPNGGALAILQAPSSGEVGQGTTSSFNMAAEQLATIITKSTLDSCQTFASVNSDNPESFFRFVQECS